MLWPLLLIFGIAVVIKKVIIQREKRQLAKSGIDQIDRMEGKSFEKYLEVLFEKIGYQVERTQYIGDYGADLITSRDGEKTVIQAKRHKQKVGMKAVQEAVAAKGYYGCNKAMVVTNSFFTPPAKRLAASNNVTLWDRRELSRAMKSMPLSLSSTESPPVTKPVVTEINLPATGVNGTTCITCGKQVSEKVREYCLSHQERFGGRVYCYDHQRNSSLN